VYSSNEGEHVLIERPFRSARPLEALARGLVDPWEPAILQVVSVLAQLVERRDELIDRIADGRDDPVAADLVAEEPVGLVERRVLQENVPAVRDVDEMAPE
jgi:hypothetical protein